MKRVLSNLPSLNYVYIHNTRMGQHVSYVSRKNIIRSFTSSSSSSKSLEDNIKILKNANAVCFDVDSTVIMDEGIDVLAAYKGAGEAVAELTKKAMGGQVLFQDALKERLDIIQPSHQDIEGCLKLHPLRITPGVKEFITKLSQKGIVVYLISGGFRQMINPVADLVNVPRHRIFANNLLFESDGKFKGFDENEPTSRDGGKPKVIQFLKDSHGYQTVVMIGDGATDMQARPPASMFVGFGGVVVRETVKKGADWWVTDFQELIQAL